MNEKPSNSIRKKKAELLSRCLVLYSLGLDYSQYADELAGLGTDKDWKDLEDRLNQVDEWMMDAGCATLAQVERVKARREKRPQRLHPLMIDREHAAAIAVITRELEASKIRYGEFVFIPSSLAEK